MPILTPSMSALSVNFANCKLRNPILAASGTCGYVDELEDAFDLSKIGAVVTKSITASPREGNLPDRIIDMPWGMLNAIGLANVGVDRFLSEKLPLINKVDTTVIASIAGDSIDDYVKVAAAFDDCDSLPIVELNVSCPNTESGLVFGESASSLTELLNAVRPALVKTKMLVKLSPNVGDIVSLANAAINSGADGLTLINTVMGMAINVDTRKPRLSTGVGGYSGPAIHPIAVRMVHDVYKHVAKDAGIPIIGLGGVMNWRDAAELILAGATLVGMGTALFANPRAPIRIIRDLNKWVTSQGVSNISELVGQIKN